VSDQENLVIRPAIRADEQYLLAMMRALAEQEPNPNPHVFREALVSKSFHFLLDHPERGRVWALAVGHKLVGYIVLTLGFSFEYLGTDAFIDELYIDPAAELYRRGGFEDHNRYLMTKWLQQPQ